MIVEAIMAWAEKRGPWFRVRYRDADGGVHTTPDKYPSKNAAPAPAPSTTITSISTSRRSSVR
ncbi:hypothetical protein GCM10009555_063990 [Acrocarpospora macrocephala]|uniref:Uncharacterized protein n=1 Tax=Acrocarpospora macrocephala TaxID=150177 RepID=A0A5M3WG65_9ACTN|nr:hypothetical protein Amac_012610 [Acrocarpospora macrocephala]